MKSPDDNHLDSTSEPTASVLADSRINGLKDDDKRVRLRAASLLAESSADIEKAVESLTEALSDGDGEVRMAAARAIAKIGQRAVEVTAQLEQVTGELAHAKKVLADVIAQKTVEEDELRKLAEELARSNQELELFAYVASHDLQEPLRLVGSYTQLLAKRYHGKLDAQADEFISLVVDGAKRMQALINDLLAYSRVQTKGQALRPTDCDVMFNAATANLRIAITESGAAVTHDRLPTVNADDVQLTQLFQNLIGNAIKFRSDQPPRVHVTTERKRNEWMFSVRDNGIGIEKDYLDRIFIIFQRVHARDKYPGTGIGLAVCKKIVERHGGRIWVESRLGMGSTFYFTIPMEQATKF